MYLLISQISSAVNVYLLINMILQVHFMSDPHTVKLGPPCKQKAAHQKMCYLYMPLEIVSLHLAVL